MINQLDLDSLPSDSAEQATDACKDLMHEVVAVQRLIEKRWRDHRETATEKQMINFIVVHTEPAEPKE